MPASSASITPVVIIRVAVCIALAHQPNAVEQGSQIPDAERGLITVESDIGECAFHTFLGSACQHGLQIGVRHADEALLGSGWCHGVILPTFN